MIKPTHALTAALAALPLALAAPPPADAAQMRTAYFTAKVSGVQTTKWSSTGRVYTDCNGRHTTTGEGTEVFRFDSGRPEKVTIQGFGSRAPTIRYDQWSRFPLADSPYGLLADVRLTRQGRIVHAISGGECGPGSSKDTGPYDCGGRRGIASVHLGWSTSGRFVTVSVTNESGLRPFDNCPVSSPTAIVDGAFTDTQGRLSPRLLFGKRRTITVVDGHVARTRSRGGEATSTTSLRLTLTRHRPRGRR